MIKNTTSIIHPIRVDFEIPLSSEIKLPRFVNLFVLNGENLHFIDSGVAAAFPQITSFTEGMGKRTDQVKTILLTHSHPDHIGAAKLIQEHSSCKIMASFEEKSWIEDTNLQFQQRPVPGFFHLVEGSVKIDQSVQNNDIIDLEKGITIQVISTPGHSKGSVSFLLNEENALFCGDAILLPGELPVFENVTDYFESLEKIKTLNPDVLYSAWDKPRHKNEIPEILEKSAEYIRKIQSAAKETAKNFNETKSIDFCRAVLEALGQNEKIANPLLLKSFLACLD